MSRTYRRRRHRYEYSWVLHDLNAAVPSGTTPLLDPRSPEGRRAIARFHSNKVVTMRGAAPRWYRKNFDRRLRTYNDKQLRRWLSDPSNDPVMVNPWGQTP